MGPLGVEDMVGRRSQRWSLSSEVLWGRIQRLLTQTTTVVHLTVTLQKSFHYEPHSWETESERPRVGR